jgi:hypothetical protein
MYSFTLSLTSVIDGSGWSTPRNRPLCPQEIVPGINVKKAVWVSGGGGGAVRTDAGKSPSHWGSNRQLSNPQPVYIPTPLSRPPPSNE